MAEAQWSRRLSHSWGGRQARMAQVGRLAGHQTVGSCQAAFLPFAVHSVPPRRTDANSQSQPCAPCAEQ